MALKQNFNVLDCTLRDGGYYNKWNFSNSFIRNYLTTQNKISSDIIEIGFRKLSKNKEIEHIEILRSLELGYKVKMVKMSNNSISIDTKSDLKKVKLKLFK